MYIQLRWGEMPPVNCSNVKSHQVDIKLRMHAHTADITVLHVYRRLKSDARQISFIIAIMYEHVHSIQRKKPDKC